MTTAQLKNVEKTLLNFSEVKNIVDKEKMMVTSTFIISFHKKMGLCGHNVLKSHTWNFVVWTSHVKCHCKASINQSERFQNIFMHRVLNNLQTK